MFVATEITENLSQPKIDGFTVNSNTKLPSMDIIRTRILIWERVQEERKRAGKKWRETESKRKEENKKNTDKIKLH